MNNAKKTSSDRSDKMVFLNLNTKNRFRCVLYPSARSLHTERRGVTSKQSTDVDFRNEIINRRRRRNSRRLWQVEKLKKKSLLFSRC